MTLDQSFGRSALVVNQGKNELKFFIFRADVSSAKIDACGFPDYGNKLISVSRTSGIAAKLVK